MISRTRFTTMGECENSNDNNNDSNRDKAACYLAA